MNIKKIISVILFTISVGLIITGFYILNSSKYIFKTVLSKSLDVVVENMYKSNGLLDDLNKADKFKIETDTYLNMIGQEMFKLNGDMNVDKNKFYLSLNSKIEGEDFIKVESLMNKEIVYFKLQDAVDKFYYYELDEINEILETENYSSIDKLTKKDIKYLVKILEKSILQNLENNDFEKNSETLVFEGKSYKTNQISLNLSEKELRQITLNLFNNIINDNESIQILQKIDNSITANDIKKVRDSFEKILNDSESNSKDSSDADVLNISFYISGLSDVVRVEFITFDSKVDSIASNDTKVTFDLYKNNANNNVTNITFKENNEEVLKVKLIQETSVKTKFEIVANNYNDMVSINGDYSVNDESIITNVRLDYNNQTMGNLVYSVLQVAKNKEYKIELKIGAMANAVNFNSVNRIVLNEDVPTIDTNNAVNIYEITEEDLEKINMYFNEKMVLLELDDLNRNSEDANEFEDIVE